MRRRTAIALGTAAIACLSMAAPAGATFHLTKIREVSSVTSPAADDSYVEVQMFAPFQNFLSNGAGLFTCDATCGTTHAFGPFANVAHGISQSTVVFGDNGVPSGSRDFNVNLNLDSIAAGGAVCYTSEPGYHDCASWGTFSGGSVLTGMFGASPGATGTPFAGALPGGANAMRRDISAGCATLLEPSDDTNVSSADFDTATRNPRPNSVTPTETKCANQLALPTTKIRTGPKNRSSDRTPTWRFSTTDPNAGFECKLDRSSFAPCSSPFTRRVKSGHHTFKVRARNANGADPSPASDSFRVLERKHHG